MKKMLIAALSVLFLIAISAPAMSKDHGRDAQSPGGYKGRPENPGHQNYKGRPDYYNHRGYRERPYDRGRHYGHYKYKGRQYDYRGHWRSWEQWDNYARKRPNLYKHGSYYREHAHLMFRFCDPGGGGCFFFSIGR